MDGTSYRRLGFALIAAVVVVIGLVELSWGHYPISLMFGGAGVALFYGTFDQEGRTILWVGLLWFFVGLLWWFASMPTPPPHFGG